MRTTLITAGCAVALAFSAPAFAQSVNQGTVGGAGLNNGRSATAPGQLGTAGTLNNGRSAMAPGQLGTAGTTNNGRSVTAPGQPGTGGAGGTLGQTVGTTSATTTTTPPR